VFTKSSDMGSPRSGNGNSGFTNSGFTHSILMGCYIRPVAPRLNGCQWMASRGGDW
jgi:hypothetical protein